MANEISQADILFLFNSSTILTNILHTMNTSENITDDQIIDYYIRSNEIKFTLQNFTDSEDKKHCLTMINHIKLRLFLHLFLKNLSPENGERN